MFQIAKEVERGNNGLNSIAPLSAGNDALGVRLRMNERARHSLDLHYFPIKPDQARVLVASKLLKAADRGVRVRIVTNALSATNHACVHGGYCRHTKAPLAAGAKNHR